MLKFGVMLRPGHFPFSHMLTCMRVAEDAGFGFMWFGDSHLIWQEVSPYLTAAASATRLTVGPLVSNPVTRHPTVMASMMATIAQLYDGRAVLGVGRGDSAVRTLGLPPMPVAQFRENGEATMFTIQIRDVALATAIVLSKQDPKLYFDIPANQPVKDPQMIFLNPRFIGFSSDDRRAQVFAKWEKYKADQLARR